MKAKDRMLPGSAKRLRPGRGGRARVAALLALTVLTAQGAMAAPVTIYAAGSLSAALPALIDASGLPAFAAPVYGPAGLLADRLLRQERADLFASADTAQPARLAGKDGRVLVVPFARNRMCVASRPSVGLSASNMLDKLTSSDVRLATSTPVADPGGDYALAVFDKAGRLRPGAADLLKAKALHLLGAPNTMAPVAGHSPAASIFLANKADALLSHCSGTTGLAKEVEGLVSLPLPEDLEVHPVYAMGILSDDPDAARFALFVLSTKGQEILSRHGLLPLVAPRP